MQPLQYVVLLLVAIGGTAVVFTRRPGRQVAVLTMYGLLLAVLLFVFSAPDVSLSEIAVGAVVLPLMTFLTLAKVREKDS